MAVKDFMHLCLGPSTVLAVEKRKLNHTCNSAGITLVAPVPATDVRCLKRRGGEVFIAMVPADRAKFG
jgi:hypothetical protein